jgi:hypothetical protein
LGRETVSVHSRGGEVIQKLMHDDPSGHSLRASRLELHDSLSGSQGAVAAWGRTENGKHVDKGSHGDGRDKEIARTFKGSYIRIDIADHKPLVDKNNPVVYAAKTPSATTTSMARGATRACASSTPIRTTRPRGAFSAYGRCPAAAARERPRPLPAADSERGPQRLLSKAAGWRPRRFGGSWGGGVMKPSASRSSADSGHSRTSRELSTRMAPGHAMACQRVSLRLDGW